MCRPGFRLWNRRVLAVGEFSTQSSQREDTKGTKPGRLESGYCPTRVGRRSRCAPFVHSWRISSGNPPTDAGGSDFAALCVFAWRSLRLSWLFNAKNAKSAEEVDTALSVSPLITPRACAMRAFGLCPSICGKVLLFRWMAADPSRSPLRATDLVGGEASSGRWLYLSGEAELRRKWAAEPRGIGERGTVRVRDGG